MTNKNIKAFYPCLRFYVHKDNSLVQYLGFPLVPDGVPPAGVLCVCVHLIGQRYIAVVLGHYSISATDFKKAFPIHVVPKPPLGGGKGNNGIYEGNGTGCGQSSLEICINI